jgi:hypothetical protein
MNIKYREKKQMGKKQILRVVMQEKSLFQKTFFSKLRQKRCKINELSRGADKSLAFLISSTFILIITLHHIKVYCLVYV